MKEQGFSADQFRKACGRFPTGIAIATVMEDEQTASGLTINSFTSVSLEPPLVLFCLHSQSQLTPCFQRSEFFGINVLAAGQSELSARYATRHSHRIHASEWQAGRIGVPVLAGSLAVLECKLRNTMPGGDHEIFVGEVLAVSVGDGAPLVRYGGSYCLLQKETSASAV